MAASRTTQSPILHLRQSANVGSQTQTQTQTSNSISRASAQPILHLRGASAAEGEENDDTGAEGATRRRIKWAEDVVDNEGMGRKKSKGLFVLFAFDYV